MNKEVREEVLNVLSDLGVIVMDDNGELRPYSGNKIHAQGTTKIKSSQIQITSDLDMGNSHRIRNNAAAALPGDAVPSCCRIISNFLLTGA